MPTLIVTLDMDCCRCSSKIQKVMSSIQDRGKFDIEKIVYAEDRVLVSGPFDADQLSCKIWCKAGKKIIKNIEVAKPPPAQPKPKKNDEKPAESKPPPAPCDQAVQYAYPVPYPQYPATWPCGCATPYCECHSKPAPPAPAPTCQCPTGPSCHCSSYPPYQMPMPMPCTPIVICEESPPACAVM